MIPIITYPLAALAFIALPAVLAIYALHNRYRRLPVSSLMLWQQLRKAAPGGVVVQRIVFPLLLLLEILALLLLALAALDMRWVVRERGRPLIAIVDNSGSMLAVTSGGGSALRAAQEELRRLIARNRFSPVDIVIAGQRPVVAARDDVVRFLEGADLAGWDGLESAGNLQDALALAIREDRQEAALLVVSDRLPAGEEDGESAGEVRWLAVGEAAPNAGFVNALRSDQGGKTVCALEIANFGFSRAGLAVEMVNGGTRGTVQVEVEPGSSRRITVPLEDPAGDLVAKLPDDSLSIDNQVTLVAPFRRSVAVRIDIADADLRGLVERAVDATGLAREESPPELLITDRPELPAARGCWRLLVTRPRDARGLAGPFFADSANPLLEGVDLMGLVWGAKLGTILPGDAMLSSAETGLLSESRTADGTPQFAMQIDPAVSTVHLAPAWPALFHNLLSLRKDALPGFRQHNLRAGMALECRLPVAAERVEIFPPGADRGMALPVAGREFTLPARRAGVYRLAAGRDEYRAAGNFLAAAESDLRRRAAGTAGKWGDLERRREQLRAAAPVLLVVSLVVLALHQFLCAARSGPRLPS